MIASSSRSDIRGVLGVLGVPPGVRGMLSNAEVTDSSISRALKEGSVVLPCFENNQYFIK